MKTKKQKKDHYIILLPVVVMVFALYLAIHASFASADNESERVHLSAVRLAPDNESADANGDWNPCDLDTVTCAGEKQDKSLLERVKPFNPTPTSRVSNPEQVSVAKEVCASKDLGDFCWKDLIAMCIKESGCQPNSVGDNGKSFGFYQIQVKLHKVSKDCAQDFRCASLWTLNHLLGHGYPTLRTYSIKRHNGSGPMATRYAEKVKLIAESL